MEKLAVLTTKAECVHLKGSIFVASDPD